MKSSAPDRRLRSWVFVTLAAAACAWGSGLLAAAADSPSAVRWKNLSVSQAGAVGFKRLPPGETGLVFTNTVLHSRYLTNQIYLNGSGVALGDVDADGLPDVFLCGVDSRNTLFRNLGGFRFAAVTNQPLLEAEGAPSTGCALADLDGDGDLDLVLNTVVRGTRILLNDGRGTFQAAPGGVVNLGMTGSSLALADYDGDGRLDLYVANYRNDTVRDMPDTQFTLTEDRGRKVVIRVNGRPVSEPDLVGRFEVSPSGNVVEFGQPDLLLHNEGGGRFTPVSFTNGVFLNEEGAPLQSPPYDWGLSVLFRDLDGDGRPDLYVCNDFDSPDRFWVNLGDGRFQAAPRLALRHTSIFSMGVDAGDLDRDGIDDLLVSDMLMQSHRSRQLRIGDVPPVPHVPGVIDDRPQYSFNTLQRGRGDGTFAEVAWYAGIEASGWTWTAVLLDVDLDGYEDVLFPTGHELDQMNADVIEKGEVLKNQRKMSRTELLQMRLMFQRFNTPNVICRNLGDLRFEDVSARWGFSDAEVSQGIALADLDGDGDLDVVMNNLNGPAALYENTGPAPRVAVRLHGRQPNTQAVGARITLRGGALPVQSQIVVSGGHYLSGDDSLRSFAAGTAGQGMQLDIAWPGGGRTRVPDVQANRLYEIQEDETATPPPQPPPASAAPWFSLIPEFSFLHRDEPFDDWVRQPLLPFRLSNLGPGVAWCDLNKDGWDDLVIGSGRGGMPAAFTNDGAGRLVPAPDAPWNRPVGRDLTGVVVVEDFVFFGSANYEDGQTNGGCIRIYDTRRKAAGESLVGVRSSTGPLAMADVDHDGDPDLFIGGRVVAGRYPEPAESVLLRNDGGRFVPAVRWEKLGLVSGAVFSDIDGDGWADLVVACEWGPVRVFHNQAGAGFQELTEALGLRPFTGLWRGVTTGDFDGDGRPDIVAGNWGLNSAYRASPQFPIRLHYGDLDGDQVPDLVESRIDPASGLEVPMRGLRVVGMAFPWLQEQVGSYEAYGKASLQQLYGDRLNALPSLEATHLATTLFLNRGDRFEARPLPPEAQFSPASGLCVADYDGDGREDLFLSQNFLGMPLDGVRQDTGRGLLLLGDGQGGFRVVPGGKSGIRIYGDQRGTAVADFNQDGRPDLVVAQNCGPAVLLRNDLAKPGLRVRLAGPKENPAALGAALRLGTRERWGPLREVHAGSGFFSQDSTAQVLASVAVPTRLEVRWPNGTRNQFEIPAGARDVLASLDGSLKTVP